MCLVCGHGHGLDFGGVSSRETQEVHAEDRAEQKMRRRVFLFLLRRSCRIYYLRYCSIAVFTWSAGKMYSRNMLESLGGKDVTMPSKARRERTAVALTTGTGSSSMVIVYWKRKKTRKRSTGWHIINIIIITSSSSRVVVKAKKLIIIMRVG